MIRFSLSESLMQLRELISAGAETITTLECLDRLLQHLRVNQQSETLHHRILLDESKKAKHAVKEIREDNTILKESLRNLQHDFRTLTLKSQQMEVSLRELQSSKEKT
jgi:hypothetical protein